MLVRGMGIKRPFCKLCETAHWGWEAHDLGRGGFEGVVSRRGLAAPKTAEEKRRREQATVDPKGDRKGRTVQIGNTGQALVSPQPSAAACEECGKALTKPKKGPSPRFCSDACRKAKSRRGKGED